MQYYVVLYHYSPNRNLESIDPSYYGTGVTRGSECKRGKNGLNKSYFYTVDEPEACVRGNGKRYEIYLPAEWQEKIYDIGADPENIAEQAKGELLAERGFVYPQELKDRIESLIIKNGYVGFCNPSFESLPHVVCLYEPMSTQKPNGQYIARRWDGSVIEKSDTILRFPFFNQCKLEADPNELLTIVRSNNRSNI